MMDEKRRAVIECRHVRKTFYALSGDHLVDIGRSSHVVDNPVNQFDPSVRRNSIII